jgi:hypothetical protein
MINALLGKWSKGADSGRKGDFSSAILSWSPIVPPKTTCGRLNPGANQFTPELRTGLSGWWRNRRGSQPGNGWKETGFTSLVSRPRSWGRSLACEQEVDLLQVIARWRLSHAFGGEFMRRRRGGIFRVLRHRCTPPQPDTHSLRPACQGLPTLARPLGRAARRRDVICDG